MFASGKTAAVASAANYIEDVFSTYLYTGNDSAQTITNGIDLAGKGGMVWWKSRSNVSSNLVQDTTRGINKVLRTNTTDAETTETDYVTAVSTTGFSVGASLSVSPRTYATWTFRKQPKFFDVVTYTGTGVARTIAHSLGSVPGCIIIKRTDASGTLWYVYHRANTSGGSAQSQELRLNNTNATNTNTDVWNNTAPTSTVFSIGAGASPYDWNASGGSYVAYLFAHDAGGFGLTGTDNVISCGSFTTNGSGAATVSLGYEPQMLIVKRTDAAEDWFMVDNMRGWFASPSVDTATLKPNTSGAEFTWGSVFAPSATGFTYNYNPSSTYIYIAIRRGPMKTPTSGTSVFSPIAYAGNDVSNRIISGLINSPDLGLFTSRNAAGQANHITGSRLQGGGRYMLTESTSSESSSTAYGIQTYGQTSVTLGTAITNEQNALGINYILYAWQRAPSFFDVVCYTGNNVNSRVLTHNLGVAPELVIIKSRTSAFFSGWSVTTSALPVVGGLYQEALLNATGGFNGGGFRVNIPSTGLTATTVTLGTDYSYGNESPNTYVMYLFATCAGVSKVGSYTGTGTTKQVDCGFTGGARFVLIKKTSGTGSWYVWDSARGIVSGNDPYLLLNSTAAEVTSTDYIDTYSAGFEISSTAPSEINENGGSFIFLAIS